MQSRRRQNELHILVSIREDDSAKSVKDDAPSMGRFVVVGAWVIGVCVEWRQKQVQDVDPLPVLRWEHTL